MPSLNDIADLAESLERDILSSIPGRCVQVRNRNAHCERCMEACQTGALSIEDNEISIVTSMCVNCGACASVCPTEALVALNPTRMSVVERCAALKPVCAKEIDAEPCVYIICARMAAKKRVSTRDCAVVPCLAYVDESLIVSVIAQHDCDLVLVDAQCVTCKYGWNDPHIQSTFEQANALLEASGSAHCAFRVHEAPVGLYEQDGQEHFGEERRNFFSTAVSEVKQTALSAAQQTIQNKLGMKQKDSIYETLRVGQNNTLPQYAMERHMQLLDGLDAFQPDPDSLYQTPLFARVAIDSALCNGCGMCVMFCPTGALSIASTIEDSNSPKSLDFLACECVNCGLCADVCFKKALTLDESITAEELFSFEPRSLDLGVSKKPKLF